MTWIYLSPHFDDVALSCGGLIWEQVQAGEGVSIWTICGGEAPSGGLSTFAQDLHERWKMDVNAPNQRKVEDINSCQILGASYRHFSIPDCIYRRHPNTGEHLYASEQALNGPLHPGDAMLIPGLIKEIKLYLPTDTTLVCPLGLGNHVDHQLTRKTANALGHPAWYYADFPYVLRTNSEVVMMEQEGWRRHIFSISKTGLAAWQDSIAAFSSQISTFWLDGDDMRQAVRDYCNKNMGNCLWSKPA